MTKLIASYNVINRLFETGLGTIKVNAIAIVLTFNITLYVEVSRPLIRYAILGIRKSLISRK